MKSHLLPWSNLANFPPMSPISCPPPWQNEWTPTLQHLILPSDCAHPHGQMNPTTNKQQAPQPPQHLMHTPYQMQHLWLPHSCHLDTSHTHTPSWPNQCCHCCHHLTHHLHGLIYLHMSISLAQTIKTLNTSSKQRPEFFELWFYFCFILHIHTLNMLIDTCLLPHILLLHHSPLLYISIFCFFHT